jgi:hypothetical protein
LFALKLLLSYSLFYEEYIKGVSIEKKKKVIYKIWCIVYFHMKRRMRKIIMRGRMKRNTRRRKEEVGKKLLLSNV